MQEIIDKLRDEFAQFVMDRIRATGDAFWDALTEAQKTRMAEAVKDIPTLGLESLLNPDRKAVISLDIKAALWTVGTDISTAMLNARDQVDDPVVRAIFELVLAMLEQQGGGEEPDA